MKKSKAKIVGKFKMTQIILQLPNLPSRILSFDPKDTINSLKSWIQQEWNIQDYYLLSQGKITNDNNLLIPHSETVMKFPMIYTLVCRLRGGKGGFGASLRSMGGRMSRRKKGEEVNVESMRDLQGRRLKTVHDAEKIAKYISKEGERRKANQEKLEEKIQKGLNPKELPKVRFDDAQFVETHEECMDKLESAIELGLKKGKRKAVDTIVPDSKVLKKNNSVYDKQDEFGIYESE